MGRICIDKAVDEGMSPLASGYMGGWGGVEGVAALMNLRAWAIMPVDAHKRVISNTCCAGLVCAVLCSAQRHSAVHLQTFQVPRSQHVQHPCMSAPTLLPLPLMLQLKGGGGCGAWC